jgi:hypothetical protein
MPRTCVTAPYSTLPPVPPPLTLAADCARLAATGEALLPAAWRELGLAHVLAHLAAPRRLLALIAGAALILPAPQLGSALVPGRSAGVTIALQPINTHEQTG